ncbi:hypothetical protein KBY65_08105 [Cyanobium sp. Alchichica 3B3-8F6]|uniref:hypothetical protein n=1 Tax=Cyanobium sp. Alchichica 3B3-8F6 TaxID=2823696 RepID=UPI0020CE29C3|nr:hypothetical protein [Cyanobium sp. Alchichica 3B3-8F6]MCP9882443.1 hypothetical protein [Cyanobium sp. Alchichica 3B3-8F6]
MTALLGPAALVARLQAGEAVLLPPDKPLFLMGPTWPSCSSLGLRLPACSMAH